MSNQSKLISYGHRPVFVVLSPKDYREIYVEGKRSQQSQNWQRLTSDCPCKPGCEEGTQVLFECTVPDSVKSNDYVVFAYA